MPEAHPLDPLSAAELERTVATLHADERLLEPLRFVTVELAEPDKPLLAAWTDGGPAPVRTAFAVVLDGAGSGFEARVDLAGGDVELTALSGAHPAITLDEYEEAG